MAIRASRLLVLDWHRVFSELPSVGTNSPFVRYCHEELPKAGLECPSRDKLAAIVDEFR
jgi:hypothetical protein